MSTQSIKKAAIINIFGKYSSIIINLIYYAILGRILSPTEFGVVAVITVFTTFFYLFANMGIGPAIIQNKEMKYNDYRSIYALTLYLGLIISVLFSFVSYPISIFYDNPEYIKIGILLSISLFFNTINIVPNAILLKEHKFKLVAYRTIFVGVVSAIPTIFFATKGLSYYSIVLHSILVSFITFFWNGVTSKVKIGFRISKSSIKKIQDFSKYQYGYALINYFSRNMDNLLIGKFIGDTSLGYYNRSYQIMQYPVGNITHAITPVLHPILSTFVNQIDVIYSKYIKILKVLSIIGIFITVYTFFASTEIMLIIFGSQWEGSAKSLQMLSLSVWAQMLLGSSGAIFQSLNKAKLMFISGLLMMFTIVPLIFIGSLFGDINQVALLVSLGYIVSFFHGFYILIKFGFDYNFTNFLKLFIIDFINAGLLFFAGFIFNHIFTENNLILSAVAKFMFLGFIYVILLIISNQYKYVLNILSYKKKDIINQKTK